MSGGVLVVMDRAGRDVKRFPLARGLATLGSAAACDIRVMLPAVSPHHATVAVHSAQTVIRNVGDGETIVNGRSVSVAALKHGDVITLGDRSLRWEYAAPTKRHQVSMSPGLRALPAVTGGGGAGAGRVRRGSAAAAPPPRPRALQLAIEMSHRASMPASSGGKQVAIVQPQRRDTSEQTESGGGGSAAGRGVRRPAPAPDPDKRTARLSPKTVASSTTKASLWIESRKALPRRHTLGAARARAGTPLRLAVLRRAQSARRQTVGKIQAPLEIDHTKQAAIMLMTGHTPRSRLSLNQARKTPSYVVKKPSPVRKTPARKSRQGGRSSRDSGDGVTPKRASTYSNSRASSKRSPGNHSVTVLEITDSDAGGAGRAGGSPGPSPLLPSPKKSALKDLTRKGNRKTESIKFDLSNLTGPREAEITSRLDSGDSLSEDDMTLHYSASSASPSPRRAPSAFSARSSALSARSSALSARSSALSARSSALSARSSVGRSSSGTDRSADATVATAFRTRTLSPRAGNVESYSIVDLVSIDSERSIYDSADSANTTDYGTPNASRRMTRSARPTLVGSSTPCPAPARARAASGPRAAPAPPRLASGGRRSKSLSTPEQRPVSADRSRPARASRSRSRINDSDLLLLDDTEPGDSSPKTSRRTRTKSAANDSGANASVIHSEKEGTPESRRSPVEAGTPVLSIQSFLNSSRSSIASQRSTKKRSVNYRRKTIGVLSESRRRPESGSRPVGGSARRAVLRLSDERPARPGDDDTITPRSSVQLVQEAVKNKHSTAKKPQSKRSIIDDLDRSDIVKQLFNSPVKRKLSRSMTEFSRRQLFEDDEIAQAARPTRNTIALTGRSIDDSISELSGTFTPERFVSPISTPGHSPNLSGIKRLFQKNTPDNDMGNVRDVDEHRPRRSARNDLTHRFVSDSANNNSTGDVGVKKGSGPSPKNDLTDVRGVKRLFGRSPRDDLRNVSGVKRTLRNSPRNDLTDVRGVGKMFRHGGRAESSLDVSGVEELFNGSSHSAQDAETLFDRLVGKPKIRAVYSKTFSANLIKKPKTRSRSLHRSLDVNTDVQEWLEQELRRRLHRDEPSRNTSRNATRELEKLATSTVKSSEPMRTRHSSMKSASETYSAHSLPLKKRSLAAGRLPLKKRAVLHSTPVKGRVDLTMNASELGRVSPIAALDHTAVNDATLARTTRLQKTIPETSKSTLSRTRTPQKTPIQSISKTSPTIKDIPEASSKAKTVASPKTKPSPQVSLKKVEKSPPKRGTRNKKNTTSENNTKKRRASLVISKKSPVMSPTANPDPRDTPQATRPKRTTRGKMVQKVETPKTTRGRARKATVVIPKPSPKLKPQTEGKKKLQTQEKLTGTRKNTTVESPKVSQPRRTRGNQNESKGKENKTVNVPTEKPKRGRKTAAVAVEPPPPARRGRPKDASVVIGVATRGKSVTKVDDKQTRSRDKTVEIQTSVNSEPTTRRGRRKNTENVTLETRPKTRGKRAEVPESEPKTRGKKVKAEVLESEPKTRGKKVKAEVPESEAETRGKKVETQLSVQSEPVTRGRRAKPVDNTVIPETKGRKRKTAATEEIPQKIAKSDTKRGRKVVEVEVDKTKDVVKTRATKDKVETSQESKTRVRAKKVEVEKPEITKVTRGRKVAASKESPVVDKRKRKIKEVSPAKGKKPSPASAKRARSVAAPEPAARRTRGKLNEESTTVAGGRSRRR